MDLSLIDPSPSDAHPETMDFLSHTWCNFAVQALQPDHHDHNQLVVQDKSLALLDNNSNQIIIKQIESNPNGTTSHYMKLDNGSRMDDGDVKSLPPWNSNDVKSWIWMQQAMHPELNYSGYFKKRWMSWKGIPFKNISIRKWLKEVKQRRKDDDRLQKAEVHAAISVAGVAAALAAMAAESSEDSGNAKDAAVASAAALVASQCAKVAEAMGAKREQLSSVIGNAMSGTSAADHIFTLAAAAKTSLKGAATLKARSGCKNKPNGIAPVLPLDDDENHKTDPDLETYRSALAKGVELGIETPDGDYLRRSISVVLSSEGKVVLHVRKLGLFKKKKESIVMDLHAELYKDTESGGDETSGTCYLIVLTTTKGTFKLDMGDDYLRYKTWATIINHMLLSSSISKYQQHLY